MNIIPAILEKEYRTIQRRAESVPEAKIIHIDICDGVFVEHKTWPFMHGDDVDRDLIVHQLLVEEIGLPRWDSVNYQLDLMVTGPRMDVDMFARLGASTLIFHPSSFSGLTDLEKALCDAQALLADVGIAFTYDEWVAAEKDVEYLLKDGGVKIFQCMSIRHIGVQGESFDDRWLTHIPDFKKKYPNVSVQMDGGIHLDNIEAVAESGVDTAIIGSAIFSHGNASDNLCELEGLV